MFGRSSMAMTNIRQDADYVPGSAGNTARFVLYLPVAVKEPQYLEATVVVPRGSNTDRKFNMGQAGFDFEAGDPPDVGDSPCESAFLAIILRERPTTDLIDPVYSLRSLRTLHC
jgi:hypothetical protein